MTRVLFIALLILLLAVLCLCLVALALAVGVITGDLWSTPTPGGPAVVTPPPPHPTPAMPPIAPPDALALQTEARFHAAEVPIADPVALHALFQAPTTPTTPPASPPTYRVGERRQFHLNDAIVTAELIHITDHTYTWLVEGVNADHSALIAAANRFETEIYPTVRRYYGSEWSPGIDSDVHLSMLHYSNPADDTAGSFDPSDELPRWIHNTSNETEMFYVNVSSMAPGDDYYFAVLAHEFEHMIHWNNDRNEADWLDEGLAELACRLSGYDPGSSDEVFRRNPDTQLTIWPYDSDTTVHYGSGYRFALYLWERFGDGLIWGLAHEPRDGLAGLDAVLAAQGTGVTADQVFADWVLVNALDKGEYAYTHEDWSEQLAMDATHNTFPVTRQTTVYPYGTDYIELTGQGALTILFQGAPQSRLLPADPHSGATAWWSNLGNRSDTHLMRRFDLSGLSSATLHFWAWYDMEPRYDYLYVSASNDDGRTWQVLSTRFASRGDYGPAYNGSSGGWIEDQADLSAYAGRPVWVRFDYITDDSINGGGFLLDDISIPELGLHDPCEEEGDWQAHGFILAGPNIPQRWMVQLIEFTYDGSTQIRRMTLDDTQAGRLDLTLDTHVTRALLAISALVSGTTEPAVYRYEITPR